MDWRGIASRDGKWRACVWLAIGDALLLVAGLVLVLSPLLLAVFIHSPLVLVLLALPCVSWVVYGFMILRAFVTVPPGPIDDGFLMDPSEAPELFGELERLRRACDAPAFDAVYIDGQMNAAIYQTGSRGGRVKHVLVLGLPLLSLLSAEQCGAIVVHEYAHISRNHGHLARWVYMARQRWHALEAMHERNHRFVTAPLRLFLSWYVPRMLRETRAFSRRCEKVADALAATICGAEMACQADVALALRGKALSDKFWPAIFARAGDEDIAVVQPYTHLLTRPAAARPRDSAEASTWVHEFLCRKTAPDDTHPSFAERVAETRVDPLNNPLGLPWSDPEKSAATRWLGEAALLAAAGLDRLWAERARQDWFEATERNLRQASEYRTLLQRRQSQVLDAQDWYRLAALARSAGQNEPIRLESLQHGLEMAPTDRCLLAMRAGDLADAGDHAGAIATWIILLHGSDLWRYRVHRRLSELYLRSGEGTRAKQEREAADALWLSFDREETSPETLGPHGLDMEELALLRRQLEPLFVQARAVWLCKKSTALEDDESLSWVLFVQAYDDWLFRAIGFLTGESDTRFTACERLLERLMPRLHLPIEARLLGVRDAPGNYCTPQARLN